MSKSLFLILLISLVLLWCLAIALDLTPFLRGPAPYPPDWRWDYQFINTYGKIWAPIGVAMLTILLLYASERKGLAWIKKHELILLLGVIILGVGFQFAVLYFNRAGINVLVHRIISPTLNGYFTASLSIQNIWLFLHEYNDSVLHLPMHAKGHPPGGVLLFWVFNHTVSGLTFLHPFISSLSPQQSDVAIVWNNLKDYQKLAALISGVVIPLISTLTVVPLYYLTKHICGVVTALRTIIAYIFIPSVVLFIPINDVFLAIFPVSAAYLLVIGLKGNKKAFLFFAGLAMAFGLFMSLSILPLLLLFATVFTYFTVQEKFTLQTSQKLGVSFIAGLALLPIMLWVATGYNAIEVALTILSGQAPERQYLTWVVYNIYDFFTLSGIAISLVFLFSVFHAIRLSLQKKISPESVLCIGFFIMLMMLNVSGIVRAEVGRIWMPFIPFMLIPAVAYITNNKSTIFSTKVFIVFLLLLIVQTLILNEYWVLLY